MKTGSDLGSLKAFKYYINNALKEDPKECASEGDGMENLCKHLLERKKFSGEVCILFSCLLTALLPTPGMSFCSSWNIPSNIPGVRENNGYLNCPCTQGSSPDTWENGRKCNNKDISCFVIDTWMGWLYFFFRTHFLSFCHQSAMEVSKFMSLKVIIFLNLSCRIKYVAT